MIYFKLKLYYQAYNQLYQHLNNKVNETALKGGDSEIIRLEDWKIGRLGICEEVFLGKRAKQEKRAKVAISEK